MVSSKFLKLRIKVKATFHCILTHANSRTKKSKRGGRVGGGVVRRDNTTSLGDVTKRVTMTTLFGGHRDCFKLLRMLHLVL